MDIKDLFRMQADFDIAHGFPVTLESKHDTYEQVGRDLVGLLGEIGEFANVVKKVGLHMATPTDYPIDLDIARGQLEEELADTLIYVARLSNLLGIDLEAATVRKIEFNSSRYKALNK